MKFKNIFLNTLCIIMFVLMTFFNYEKSFAQQNKLHSDIRLTFLKVKKLQRENKHKEANLLFREMIAINKTLPQDFAYYFSVTLYHTHQYQNAYNFIEKYISLLGKTGNNYEEAIILQGRIEKELEKIHACQLCDKFGYRYEVCYQCKGEKNLLHACHVCKEVGTIVCPKCKGEGIIITTNVFQINEYHTCSMCKLERRTTCPQCKGKKKFLSACDVCLGSGAVPTKELCNHDEL